MQASKLIKELKEMGISKWKISKECKVHWNTVNLWDKGVFNATPEHIKQLENMKRTSKKE